MGPLIPAILALALGVPSASAQSRFDFPQAENALDQDLDPRYAADFLKDIAAQRANELKDPDREARLVERATALKDMADLLVDDTDPASLNEALRLRLGDDSDNPDAPKMLGFAARPGKLLDWRERYFNDVPAGRLETALWEWKTLTSEQHVWLAAPPRSYTERRWETASFARRFTALRKWKSAIYALLMKTSPKTPGDLALMMSARNRIWNVMDYDEKRLSGEYMTKASAAVDGLQRIDALPQSVRESADPAIKGLLAKARSGATPEETLAALAEIFDKAGVHDDAVQAQAPNRPDQELTRPDRRLLSRMLGAGLRAEIGDVDAGRAVDGFFDAHPLKIEVRDLSTNLAQYESWTGAIVLNGRFITNWVKDQGLSVQAVISNPARFHELVMTLAPVFVHESTHQMQKAYADEHGVYAWVAQHQEIEAMEVDSAYVLEKEAKDPSYRQFLARMRDHSYFVQQDIARTDEFVRDPRAFRAVVMNDYYADLPSLEKVESDKLLLLDDDLEALKAEKRRRAALSAPARAEIERTGFDQDKDFEKTSDWKNYLMKVRTAAIEELIADQLKERDKVLKTYRLASARDAQALDHIESAAQAAIRGDAALKSKVPSPGRPQ